MNGEVADVLKTSKESMDKVIETAKRDFSTIRTGRANPAILERVQAECYGALTPPSIAGISAPNRGYGIQLWISRSSAMSRRPSKRLIGVEPDQRRVGDPPGDPHRPRSAGAGPYGKAVRKEDSGPEYPRDAKDKIKKLEKDGLISEDEPHPGRSETHGQVY